MKKALLNDIDFRGAHGLVETECQSCGSKGMRVFHVLKSVPTNSCIMLKSREEALCYPKGDIALGFCEDCGFISNVAFNPELAEYSDRYEETQGFSPTFNNFQRDLAEYLINRYQLYSKDIIEIGCGKGEFLTLLSELGGNRGVGFDPAYISERNESGSADKLTFINDFYSEKYSDYKGDALICKMTLEHLADPVDFITMIRRSMGDRTDTIVFFQIPNAVRILKDCSFEDIYYEHCSYVSPASISRLFRKCGFNLLNLTTVYRDQYLMIEALPASWENSCPFSMEDDLEQLKRYVATFEKNYQKKLEHGHAKLEEIRAGNKRVVIWGSGSKGVAFLNSLNIIDEIRYAVDINPYRHGFYMAGTGQKIVAPEFLREYKPDMVVIMNPIYYDEIEESLKGLGLSPEVITV